MEVAVQQEFHVAQSERSTYFRFFAQMERLTDRDLHGRTTVLFLDEIHRFNKAQQDALLPGVENQWVVLVAATTENPSFSVISPLLSRSLLLTLQPLERADIGALLDRAVADPRGLNGEVELSAEAREHPYIHCQTPASEPANAPCDVRRGSGADVALIGDSYAVRWLPALERVAADFDPAVEA